MATVGVREFRQHIGDVMERVLGGETVTITNRNRPVAEIRPLRRCPECGGPTMSDRRSAAPEPPAR